MKKILFNILLIGLVSVLPINSFAQCLKGSCCKQKLTKKQATEIVVKALSLTDVQATQLAALNEKYADLVSIPFFKGHPQPLKFSGGCCKSASCGKSSSCGKSCRSACKCGGDKSSSKCTCKGKCTCSKQETVRECPKKRIMREIGEYIDGLKTILTPEQMKQYLSL